MFKLMIKEINFNISKGLY